MTYVSGEQNVVFAYELGVRRASVIILERIAKLYLMSIDQVIGLAPERPGPKRRKLAALSLAAP